MLSRISSPRSVSRPAAVLLLTDAGRETDLGELIRDNISDQIQSAEDFINENTP